VNAGLSATLYPSTIRTSWTLNHETRAPGLFTLIRHLQNFSPAAFSYDGPLYPVHRLDKATSGCLLLAKSKEAAAQISKAFASRHVAKYYIAVTDKKPSKKMGSVSGDMQRSRRSSWKLLRSQQNPAVTSFMQTSFALEGYGTLRLFALKPHTGKTHQLRVITTPLFNDEVKLLIPRPKLSFRQASVRIKWLNRPVLTNRNM